jgi:hypothetical protein
MAFLPNGNDGIADKLEFQIDTIIVNKYEKNSIGTYRVDAVLFATIPASVTGTAAINI